LLKALPFFKTEIDKIGRVRSIYETDGTRVSFYNNVGLQAAPLAASSVLPQQATDEMYANLIEYDYSDEGYWGQADNYYDQNWAWFATALYSGLITKN